MKHLLATLLTLGLLVSGCSDEGKKKLPGNSPGITEPVDEEPGEEDGENEAEVVTISISPISVTLQRGATQQFTATVKGDKDTSVTWSVTEAGGGTVSEAGLYTAPAVAGSYHVVATSKADATKTAQATITVQAPVVNPPTSSVTISPTSATVNIGDQVNFSASIDGTPTNNGVDWTATCGTIQNNGNFSAPDAAGSCVVTATDKADATQSASATVTVVAPVSTLTLDRTTARIEIDGQLSFIAYINGSANNHDVTWTVTEANGGSVNPNGKYSAPVSTTGVFHVVATLDSDPTKKATVTITVVLPTIEIKMTPLTASVEVGGNHMFAASITSSAFNGITYSIQEGATGGYITQNGLYTAPASIGGPYHVVATSDYDNTKTIVATVTIRAINPIITVTPNFPRVETEDTMTFSVSVTNSRFTGWYATLPGNVSNNDAGSLDNDMLTYTAPSTVGTYAYKVTSSYDAAFQVTVNIDVHAPEPYVNISAAPTSTSTENTIDYSVSVTNTQWTAVTWSIIGNVAANKGSIDTNGYYTAPITPGTYTIRATSVAKPTVFDEVTVDVYQMFCPTGARIVLYEEEDEEENRTPSFYARIQYSSYPTQESHVMLHDLGVLGLSYYAHAATTVDIIDGIGPDGFLGSFDDHIARRTTFTYDGSGNLVRYANMVSGADGKIGTGDDVETGGEIFIWDGDYLEVSALYVNLGIDGNTVANGEITEVRKYDNFYNVYRPQQKGIGTSITRQYPREIRYFSSPGEDLNWDLTDCWSCGDDDYASREYREMGYFHYTYVEGWGSGSVYTEFPDYQYFYNQTGNGEKETAFIEHEITSWRGVYRTYFYHTRGNGDHSLESYMSYDDYTDYGAAGGGVWLTDFRYYPNPNEDPYYAEQMPCP